MISENLKRINDEIDQICLKIGRNRSEIRLIGVSKTQPVEIIKEALDAGLKDFGENKAQEFRDKSALLFGDFNWHFIGHLQTNKVKYVINHAQFIHSVDSIKLAEELNKKSESISKSQNILLEINTSSEASKFGLKEEKEIFATAEFCEIAKNLNLVGLMTMAPYTNDQNIIRNCFKNLKKLMDRMNNVGYNLKELSMGMTNDYVIAIEEGSTMLRIGTAIFGERN